MEDMTKASSRADILIRGGTLIDGTGSSRRRVDLAIENGRIAAVGDLSDWDATTILDATGLVVAPGFIDMHTHSDLSLLINPRAESKIRQGVTTEVIGQCGFSPAPAPSNRRESIRELFGEWGKVVQWTWGSFGDYLAAFERDGISVNVVPVVGHGILRAGILDEDNAAASDSELLEMKGGVRRALDEGAFGMSTGLIYAPGMFADIDELTALACEVAAAGGVYFSHIRSEAENLIPAIEEAIEVGRRSGVRVQISHLKAEGRPNWGKTGVVLNAIEEARSMDVDVGFDVYPYTAWHTSLGQVLPAWAREGGTERILARLTDERIRPRLQSEIAEAAESDPGRWERRLLAAAHTTANRSIQGMTIAEIAADRKRLPEEVIIDLLVEERLDADMVGFGMDEGDVRRVLAHPLATIGSDSASAAPYGVLGENHTHPRTYGAFARVLGYYMREETVFSLENAVAKMTGRSAERLHLHDRGRLVPDLAADVVVFDPTVVRDEATYDRPHQYAAGIRWVIVNGMVEIDGDTHMDRRPGRVLTPPLPSR